MDGAIIGKAIETLLIGGIVVGVVIGAIIALLAVWIF